jgi:eukaryotic-like serine/threonine-protein kinase
VLVQTADSRTDIPCSQHRSPFQGTPAQLLDLQIRVQPAAPSTLNQRVSPAIDSVVLTALAKRPEDRFPSVSAFARALEQAIQRPASMFAGAPEMFAHDILRATLLISKTEAKKGTLRNIALPSGQRITVSVPKGAYDGQIIRLEGFNGLYPIGAGVLLLTIAISKNETGISVRGLTKQKHPRQKAVILVSLILVILLGSIGLFSRLRISNVSIPYPPLIGSLAIDDTLHDNTRGYNWPDGTGSNSSISQFIQGAYHVVMTQAGAFHYCIAGNTEFSNFAYEVRMTIVKGDEGGIIFRADGLNSKFYYFRIGRDGSYDLYLYVDTVGAHAKRLTGGITPTIHIGLNHPNLLAVVARNNTLDLYVNNQNITHVSNNAYNSGQIGVAASFDTDLTEVAFSNLKVWKL